jgi:hypothetical protein
MHDTMMHALKNETPEKNRFQKEIDYASQLHQQEREEL